MDIVYLNTKIDSKINKFCKFFSIPVYKIKLSLTYKEFNTINIFEKGVISLLLADTFTIKEIADKLHLREELVEVILLTLKKNNYVDSYSNVTEVGKKYFFNNEGVEKFKIAHAFYDINNQCFLKDLLFDDVDLLYNDARKENDEFIFTHRTESNNEKVRFCSYNISNNKDNNITQAILEKKLEKFLYNMKKNSNGEIISSHFIINKPVKTNILTRIIGKFDYNEESCKHSINFESPLSNKIDKLLANSIYSNLNKDSKMKKLIDDINDDIFEYRFSSDKNNNKKNKERIINKMFTTKIKSEHMEYITSLQSIINKLPSINLSDNDENKSEKRLALKSCLVALADMFEMLLFNSFKLLDYKPKNFSSNRNTNKNFLTNMSLELGHEFVNTNVFSVSSEKIESIFSLDGDKTINDMIISTIILCNDNKNYCLSKYVKKNIDFLNDLYIFSAEYRNDSRHNVDNIDVSSRELNKYLDILFDLFREVHGYEFNLQFRTEIFNYSYTELPLYTNKAIEVLGIDLVESNNRDIVLLKEHIINSYVYYKSNNSNYFLTLKPIVDSIIKKIANRIIRDLNISPYKSFDEYGINTVLDFIDTVNSLGFKIELNSMFDSKLEKSLYLNKNSNEYMNKGMINYFKKSNNRPVLQTLILMLKNDKRVLDYFIINGCLYEEFFIVISSFMFVTSSHNQKNYEFNQKEADYLITNIFELITKFKEIL